MKKKYIIRLFFAVWVWLWILFTVQPYFIRDIGKKYSDLFPLTSEEKRSYILGDDVYLFIQFCKNSLPKESNYWIEGLHGENLTRALAVYYLFPHYEYIEQSEEYLPEYILVYENNKFSRNGYSLFLKYNENSCIFKKDKL